MRAIKNIIPLIPFLLLTVLLLATCESPTELERNNPLDESAGNYEGPFTFEERMEQLGIDLVSIPAGSFQMGSSAGAEYEQPIHTVELEAFEMSSTEITFWQYYRLIDYFEELCFSKKEKNQALSPINWYDAVRFCNRLSDLTGLESCYDETTWECDFSKNGFRLPTEAEWEYAVRAGTTTDYYTGDNEDDLARAGWFAGNRKWEIYLVGQKEPNMWGLYDMHGNLWEWCHDWYDFQYYSRSPAKNPTGPNNGNARMVRGGNFESDAGLCRSSHRHKYNPDNIQDLIGFRIVRGTFIPYYSITGEINEVDDVTITLSGDASSSQTVSKNQPTDIGCSYSFTVAHGGDYTITPAKTGYTFLPESVTFNNVTSNQTRVFNGSKPQ